MVPSVEVAPPVDDVAPVEAPPLGAPPPVVLPFTPPKPVVLVLLPLVFAPGAVVAALVAPPLPLVESVGPPPALTESGVALPVVELVLEVFAPVVEPASALVAPFPFPAVPESLPQAVDQNRATTRESTQPVERCCGKEFIGEGMVEAAGESNADFSSGLVAASRKGALPPSKFALPAKTPISRQLEGVVGAGPVPVRARRRSWRAHPAPWSIVGCTAKREG